MADEQSTAKTIHDIMQNAGGEPPTAALFYCKDGDLRNLTAGSADPPCPDCDCGYAALIKQPTPVPDMVERVARAIWNSAETR